MELAVITLIALACSTVMSILAFIIGRCGRNCPSTGCSPASYAAHGSVPRPAGPAPPRNPQDLAGPLPAARTVVLHRDCSLLDGALAEPFACVIGGLEMLSFREYPRIVLVGAGFMGLLALRYLTVLGHRVLVIEPRARARELARRWGADGVVHPDETDDQMRRTQPIVIEATGAAEGLNLASDLVGIDGTLGVLGYHQSNGGARTVDMQGWNFRALRVVSLHNRSTDNILTWMDRAQRSAALGFICPSHLVDRHVNLDELPDVLANKHEHDAIKTVLCPDADQEP